jgi:outer membrane protein insertion porin family
MRALLMCAALACCPAYAQKRPAPAPSRWPVESLAVEGNRNYTAAQVLAVAGVKIGEMAGKAEFEAARDRLVATGAFESVGYRFAPGPEGKGYAAVFQVVEVEPVYPVRFEDLGVPDSDAERLLRSKDSLFSPEKVPATKTVIERYARLLEEYLASKGMKEKIAAQVTPVGAEHYVILFRPARNRPAVAQINFEGNKVLASGVLREALAGTAIGSEYTEAHFRELLNNALRPVYEARGRVRVGFPKLRAEPAADVAGVNVTVTVDEGESYTLGKVAVEGPTPLKPEDLLKTGDFKTGDVANFDRVAEGLVRMRGLLRRAGYMEAAVTTERRVDDAKKTVDLALHVEAGPRFIMGTLAIKGLDLDAEAEIRRIWGLKEGRPFNADYPRTFLDSVREQGLFDNLGETKSDLKTDPASHTVDVTLTFGGSGEQKPGRKRRE